MRTYLHCRDVPALYYTYRNGPAGNNREKHYEHTRYKSRAANDMSVTYVWVLPRSRWVPPTGIHTGAFAVMQEYVVDGPQLWERDTTPGRAGVPDDRDDAKSVETRNYRYDDAWIAKSWYVTDFTRRARRLTAEWVRRDHEARLRYHSTAAVILYHEMCDNGFDPADAYDTALLVLDGA